jgi:hypothetical protein
VTRIPKKDYRRISALTSEKLLLKGHRIKTIGDFIIVGLDLAYENIVSCHLTSQEERGTSRV